MEGGDEQGSVEVQNSYLSMWSSAQTFPAKHSWYSKLQRKKFPLSRVGPWSIIGREKGWDHWVSGFGSANSTGHCKQSEGAFCISKNTKLVLSQAGPCILRHSKEFIPKDPCLDDHTEGDPVPAGGGLGCNMADQGKTLSMVSNVHRGKYENPA